MPVSLTSWLTARNTVMNLVKVFASASFRRAPKPRSLNIFAAAFDQLSLPTERFTNKVIVISRHSKAQTKGDVRTRRAGPLVTSAKLPGFCRKVFKARENTPQNALCQDTSLPESIGSGAGSRWGWPAVELSVMKKARPCRRLKETLLSIRREQRDIT